MVEPNGPSCILIWLSQQGKEQSKKRDSLNMTSNRLTSYWTLEQGISYTGEKSVYGMNSLSGRQSGRSDDAERRERTGGTAHLSLCVRAREGREGRVGWGETEHMANLHAAELRAHG